MNNSDPEFLKINPGETVLIGDEEIRKDLIFVGGERDPLLSKLFQVENIDTREIHWIHNVKIIGIVSTRES